MNQPGPLEKLRLRLKQSGRSELTRPTSDTRILRIPGEMTGYLAYRGPEKANPLTNKGATW